MKFLIPTIFALLVLIIRVSGQDPQFTQFYSNPLYQSPSFAGAVLGYRASLNYRDQWPKMPGKLTTVNAAIDVNLDKFNSGIGIIALRDMAGSVNYSNTYIGLLYAYNIRITRKIYFRPGVGFYFNHRTLDYEKMRFASQMVAEEEGTSNPASPVQLAELSPVTTYDGSLSALLLMHNFWLGFTADHLMQPNISVTDLNFRLPIKYTAFAGLRIYKMERLIGTTRQSITVAGSYRHQGLADQFDLGLYWHYPPIVLGFWYRDLPLIKDYSRRDALAVLLGYNFKDFSFGYSYDFTISRLITSTGGAHEISIIYKFEVEKRRKFKPIPCPEF